MKIPLRQVQRIGVLVNQKLASRKPVRSSRLGTESPQESRFYRCISDLNSGGIDDLADLEVAWAGQFPSRPTTVVRTLSRCIAQRRPAGRQLLMEPFFNSIFRAVPEIPPLADLVHCRAAPLRRLSLAIRRHGPAAVAVVSFQVPRHDSGDGRRAFIWRIRRQSPRQGWNK